MQPTIESIKLLLDGTRKKDIPIVWTQHGPPIEIMSVGWAEVRSLDDTIASINKLG